MSIEKRIEEIRELLYKEIDCTDDHTQDRRVATALIDAGYVKLEDLEVDEKKVLEIINDGLMPCDQSSGTVYKLWSPPEATAKAISTAEGIIKVKEQGVLNEQT